MPKLSINDAKDAARLKNGKCLSSIYINNKQNLEWECEKGHRWSACLHSIRIGKTWCRVCAHKSSITIEQVQNLAKSRGGTCLAKTYINNETPMLFQCAIGHIWSATYHNMAQGSWCITCNCKKNTLQDAQNVAKQRGGQCLSTEYKNRRANMLWQCARGHQWPAAYYSIVNGTWCPHCRIYANEQKCRLYLQELTHSKFPSCKEKWLKGHQIDGYNRELNLAFEYNGKQHYEYVPHFHRGGKDNLETQKTRDTFKQTLCNTLGIFLIVIPYYEDWKTSIDRQYTRWQWIQTKINVNIDINIGASDTDDIVTVKITIIA